jgi:hypothetical protein
MLSRIENDLSSVYQVYFMDEVTTVKVTKRTKAKLSELGKKDETYEQIIRRLIDFYTNNASGQRRRSRNA